MYAHRNPIVKVEDPTIPTRIDALLGNGLVNPWETNFLSSIKAGYDKYKSLTEGQNKTFQKRVTALMLLPLVSLGRALGMLLRLRLSRA
jgi:hypothetical protein